MKQSRNIAHDLLQGLQEIQEHYTKKITLKTVKLSRKKSEIAPKDIRHIREKLNISQGVFALYLNTGITTYRNWEQGIAKPNGQAIVLLKILDSNPEMLSVLKQLATDSILIPVKDF